MAPQVAPAAYRPSYVPPVACTRHPSGGVGPRDELCSAMHMVCVCSRATFWGSMLVWGAMNSSQPRRLRHHLSSLAQSGSCQIAQRTICSNGPSAGNNESLLLAGTLAPRHGPYGLRRRTTPRITATWGREPRPCLAVGAKAYAPKAGSGRTKQACRNCLTRSTPQWRVGPEGPNTLCNACGMRMRKGHILKRYADWGSKKELGTSALKSALACSTRS